MVYPTSNPWGVYGYEYEYESGVVEMLNGSQERTGWVSPITVGVNDTLASLVWCFHVNLLYIQSVVCTKVVHLVEFSTVKSGRQICQRWHEKPEKDIKDPTEKM